MIANKYVLLEKINEGSFGVLFKAQNNRTKEMVAIKFENKSEQIKVLKHEAKIYQYLGRLDGFPQIKTFGSTDTFNYLVINLLGESVFNIITRYGNLSLKTTLLLGIQSIKRIQSLHEKSIVHRDIKPSNFMIGGNNDTNKLFLVDLGFCKCFDLNGTHMIEKKINHIIGSPNYASLNVHNNIEPSRRDDLESCIYVILTMLLGNPIWYDKHDLQEIVLLKQDVLNMDNVPLFIKTMLKYIRALAFAENPNYEYIIDLMMVELDTNKMADDGIFEWSTCIKLL